MCLQAACSLDWQNKHRKIGCGIVAADLEAFRSTLYDNGAGRAVATCAIQSNTCMVPCGVATSQKQKEVSGAWCVWDPYEFDFELEKIELYEKVPRRMVTIDNDTELIEKVCSMNHAVVSGVSGSIAGTSSGTGCTTAHKKYEKELIENSCTVALAKVAEVSCGIPEIEQGTDCTILPYKKYEKEYNMFPLQHSSDVWPLSIAEESLRSRLLHEPDLLACRAA